MPIVRRVLVLTVVLAIAPGTAAAQTSTAEAAAVDAVAALHTEIMLLVELGAVSEPIPQVLRDVHHEWADYAAGLSGDRLLGWLDEADAQGVDALDRFVAAGGVPSPAVEVVLGPIASGDRLAIGAGGTMTLNPNEYATAIATLERDLGDVASATGVVAAGVEGVPLESAGAASIPDLGLPVRDEYPWRAVSVALASVLVVGMLMIMFDRRRLAADHGSESDRLVDAAWRMTQSYDGDAVVGVTLTDEADAVASPSLAMGPGRGGHVPEVAATQMRYQRSQ